MAGYLIACLKCNACKRRGFLGIDSGFSRCQKNDGYLTKFDLEDCAQTQIRFGVTNPALTGGKYLRHV